MATVKLDPAKLLGFRIAATDGDATLSVKLGDKVGNKEGDKASPVR